MELDRSCPDRIDTQDENSNSLRITFGPSNGRSVMSSPKSTKDVRVDRFFTGAEARFDRWRSLVQAARSWEGVGSQQSLSREASQAGVSASFQELRQWEDFFAYPGHALLKTLSERIDAGDATGTVRLAQTLSAALLTHSYRNNLSDWEGEEQSPIGLAERVPGGSGETAPHRPYFEVLVVSTARPAE